MPPCPCQLPLRDNRDIHARCDDRDERYLDSFDLRKILWRGVESFPDSLGKSTDIILRHHGNVKLFFRMHMYFS